MKKLAILILLMGLTGCVHNQNMSCCKPCDCENRTENADSVKIVEVHPTVVEPLMVGDTVSFKFKVEYQLTTSDTGSIVMVVQGSGNESLGNEVYPITKGQGEELLEASITIPDTRSITIFTPMSTPGNSSTTTVDSRTYRVGQ